MENDRSGINIFFSKYFIFACQFQVIGIGLYNIEIDKT